MSSSPRDPHDDLDLGATVRGLAPGQKVFGRYTLRRILGRGGMGVVWLAQDESLEREVAIKLLPEVVTGDVAAVRDMKRETSRSQRLGHPHILRIYDFVEAGTLCGITMELVGGGNLTELRVRQPEEVFGVGQLERWVQQACEALDYAHTKVHLVHRDLKPANLMVDEQGDLKVADFGIAASITETVSRVSRGARVDGSLPYMSPQQLLGEKPAVTDDVYALGATLYELQTGKPPFFRGGAAAIMHQIQTVLPPTMTERRRELGVNGAEFIPEAWEETVAACLAKEAGARPRSAGEVWEGLKTGKTRETGKTGGGKEEISERRNADASRSAVGAPMGQGKQAEAAAPESKKSKSGLWLGLAAGLVVLAGAGYWFGVQAPEQARTAEVTLDGGKTAVAKAVLEKQIFPEAGEAWENTLGMKFVPVPGTEVLFGVWETREEDYGAFVRATGRNWSSANAGGKHPAVWVSWEDAKAFCAWLTEKERKEGRLGPEHSYRLPADWEWSVAVGLNEPRSGSPKEKDDKIQGEYPWGKLWPAPRGAGNYDSKLNVDDFSRTSPVGSFAPNGNGLHDLGGNVWEWCEDLYDGQGGRVFRGAGFDSFEPRFLLSSVRDRLWPNHPRDYIGFRCVIARGQSTLNGGDEFVPVADPVQPEEGMHWGNTLGMRFLPVDGTEVLFSAWEVRNRDYEAFVLKTGRQWPRMGWDGPNHPAVNVSWSDANAFCAWLTEEERKAGKLKSDQRYRLPTDWEWSVAVGLMEDRRGTPKTKNRKTEGIYPWGVEWPPPIGAGNYGTKLKLEGYGLSAPVGSFTYNKFGLSDLGGNVWEWCEDAYDENRGDRVIRGGSFLHDSPGDLLSSNRDYGPEGSRGDSVGFRCVIAVKGEP